MRKKPGLKLNLSKTVQEADNELKSTPHAPTIEDEIFQVEENLFLTGYAGAKNKKRLSDIKIDLIINLSTTHCDSPYS